MLFCEISNKGEKGAKGLYYHCILRCSQYQGENNGPQIVKRKIDRQQRGEFVENPYGIVQFTHG